MAKFGPASERANTAAFRGDPDLPLLLSLEHYDVENRRATKAAIFRERTVQRQRPPHKVETAKDALLVSLSERGGVDLEFISALLHRPAAEFLPGLKGAIFLNPQTNRWETENEYLSGNVRAKLQAAEAAALADEQFQSNVEALKAVQPTDLSASCQRQLFFTVGDNQKSPGTPVKLFTVSSCHSLSLTLWTSPFGEAESLAPLGAKGGAEPKGLVGPSG